MMSVVSAQEIIPTILKNLHIKPRGVQKEALDRGLLDGKSLLICSPTGSGKTLVGEMALLRAFVKNRYGLYLVPLRALAVQVAEGMRERYESEHITIGETHGDFQLLGENLSEYNIIVTTYERADSLLRHGASWLSNIGTVVIDEIQNLSDDHRGARLESIIMRLKRVVEDVQLIGLSATVGSPVELAEWLECDLVESDERPVPLRCHVVNRKNRKDMIQELVMTNVQKNGQVIVFHRTRRETEVDAERLSESVSRHLTNEERTELDSQMDSIEHWNVNLPPDLKAIIHNGIAYHHAGLGSRTRRMVESLFNKGLLRVLCATTTLASGMNLPAAAVIVTTARSPADYKKLITANKVHQMLGRAGRPNRDPEGRGYILTESLGEATELTERYFTQKEDSNTGRLCLVPVYNEVESAMSSTDALTEQLLVALDFYGEASLEEIQYNFLNNSYLMHRARHSTKKPLRIIELGETTAVAAIERHAVQDHVIPARDGYLGNVQIRELSEKVIGGLVSMRGTYTCRYSIRLGTDSRIEGPQCSCGEPIGTGDILCEHLVALGLAATKSHPDYANYIIPLSLSESSPSGTLIRLGLIEGATDGRLKPTHLGRVANRLYLSIATIKEMLPMVTVIEDNTGLLDLISHLIAVETGQVLPDSFEHMLGLVLSTDISLYDIAKTVQMHMGDMYGYLEQTRWLTYAVSSVAHVEHMVELRKLADNMLERIEQRLRPIEGDNYDN